MSNVIDDMLCENGIYYTHDEKIAKKANGYCHTYKALHIPTGHISDKTIYMGSTTIGKFYELLNLWNCKSNDWKYYAYS